MRDSVLIVNKLPDVSYFKVIWQWLTRSHNPYCAWISHLPSLYKQFTCSSGSGSTLLCCPVSTVSIHLTPLGLPHTGRDIFSVIGITLYIIKANICQNYIIQFSIGYVTILCCCHCPVWSIIGIIRVQISVYWKIIYSSLGFNR